MDDRFAYIVHRSHIHHQIQVGRTSKFDKAFDHSAHHVICLRDACLAMPVIIPSLYTQEFLWTVQSSSTSQQPIYFGRSHHKDLHYDQERLVLG